MYCHCHAHQPHLPLLPTVLHSPRPTIGQWQWAPCCRQGGAASLHSHPCAWSWHLQVGSVQEHADRSQGRPLARHPTVAAQGEGKRQWTHSQIMNHTTHKHMLSAEEQLMNTTSTTTDSLSHIPPQITTRTMAKVTKYLWQRVLWWRKILQKLLVNVLGSDVALSLLPTAQR